MLDGVPDSELQFSRTGDVPKQKVAVVELFSGSMKPFRTAEVEVMVVADAVLTVGGPRVVNELTSPYVTAQLLVVTVCQ
jgi:hypothetical protein